MMIIGVENVLSGLSSNSRQGCLSSVYTNALFPSVLAKIVGHIGSLALVGQLI